MKKLFLIVKLSVLFLSLIFFGKLFFINLKDFPEINYFQKIPIFSFAIFISIFSYLLLSLSWYKILHFFSLKINFLKSFVSYNISQVGKYIPGNFSHFIARGYLDLKDNKITTKDSFYALLLESLLLIFSSLTIVFFSINKFNLYFFGFHLSSIYFIAFYFGYVFFTIYIIFLFYSKKIISYNLILIIFYYLIYFLLQGLILKMLVSNIYNINFSLLYISSVISLSWVIGFIVPGAPAGLGLRELLIVNLLSGNIELPQSISISLYYRFITMSSELFLFIFFLVIKKIND